MATQGVVRLPGGQKGTELLPDGLDDVWWQGGHGVCSFCSGSLEDSPHDRASVSAFHLGALRAYWRSLLGKIANDPTPAGHIRRILRPSRSHSDIYHRT